jgi:hypothetical protein
MHHTMADGTFAPVTVARTRLTPRNAASEIDRLILTAWREKLPVYMELPSGSACFILFASAYQKTVFAFGPKDPRVGIHSAANPTGVEDLAAFAVDTVVAREAKKCGVPDDIIGKMVTTPNQSVYWLTREDFTRMGATIKIYPDNVAPPGVGGDFLLANRAAYRSTWCQNDKRAPMNRVAASCGERAGGQ